MTTQPTRIVRYIVALAATITLGAAHVSAADIKIVTVHCDIKNEDKEKPCSFKFVLKKDGQTVFEKTGWGLEEAWEDNTPNQVSTDDVSGSKLARKGNYVLSIQIDNGKNCDIDCEWYIEVQGTDGKTITGSKFRKFFRNQQTEAEHKFTLKK